MFGFWHVVAHVNACSSRPLRVPAVAELTSWVLFDGQRHRVSSGVDKRSIF